MLLVGFDPTFSAGERQQTYALDRAATGTGKYKEQTYEITLRLIGIVYLILSYNLEYLYFISFSTVLSVHACCTFRTDALKTCRVQLKCDGTRWRREGKWRGNWRMEWVASILHTTSEHGVSSITTADAHTSAASIRLNWRPCRFKWTRPFRRKTKSGFCACAITFQTQSTHCNGKGCKFRWPLTGRGPYCANLRC